MVSDLVLEGDVAAHLQSLVAEYQPTGSILSSVIDHDHKIDDLLSSYTRFHRLTSTTRLNFSIAVNKPETIGADRIALMAAVVHNYPGKNNLVIGLGTCITFNFVNQEHQFLGGSISPGMEMRFRAMHEFTARLPLVESQWSVPLIGYDTKTNLQSGVIHGMVAEIDGIINKYRERYGNFNAVLTGGNSAYFAGQLKSEIFADSNFLFKGLYALSELNNYQN